MLFSELGLSEPLLRAISEQGYDTPTPIQAQGIPAVLSGRDIMAAAQTGTGKTAGFTLPMLHLFIRWQPPQCQPYPCFGADPDPRTGGTSRRKRA